MPRRRCPLTVVRFASFHDDGKQNKPKPIDWQLSVKDLSLLLLILIFYYYYRWFLKYSIINLLLLFTSLAENKESGSQLLHLLCKSSVRKASCEFKGPRGWLITRVHKLWQSLVPPRGLCRYRVPPTSNSL